MNITIRTRQLASGNQSLYLDCYDNGKRWYEALKLYLVPETNSTSRKLNADARRAAVAIKAQRMLGIEKVSQPKENGDTAIFAEWLDNYLESKRRTESESYYKRTRSFVNIVKAYLHHSRRLRLTFADITKNFCRGFNTFIDSKYMNTKSATPQPLAAGTKYLLQQELRTLLNVAVRRGLIKENPLYALDRHEKAPKPITQRDFLTADEVRRMEQVETGSPATKQCYLFCCFTGLRHGDLAALTWQSVQRTDAGLALRIPSMQKTRKPVYIPLGSKALALLPDREGKSPIDKVFAVPCISCCDRALKRMAQKAGITKGISFHTSRHTFATLALCAGCDIETVSKLLGHTSVRTTQIYADVVMQMKVSAVNAVSGLFD